MIGVSNMKTTRHTCPRDCYDACGILAHVDDNHRLVKVTGDYRQSYTKGKLCCKGYTFTQYVYHPERVIYPMKQSSRFSGNWERISWEEALESIGDKILHLKDKYDSYLPIAYMKGGGNYGVLAEAVKGLFTSLGPISIVNAAGALCLAAAWDAQMLDFGAFISPQPEEMENANTLILWGTNPVETAIHQVSIIENVRKRGGKVLLIDIYPSKTSILADEFIQVRPGGDGALALAILKQLLLLKKIENHTMNQYPGWQEFSGWLMNMESTRLSEVSGVSSEIIAYLARLIGNQKPVSFWIGSGMQRYSNGGQNIRNIHALAFASGNIGISGGGIYFPHIDHWKFTHKFDSYAMHPYEENRFIGVNDLAGNLANCQNPPIKFLWITSCNPFARSTNIKKLRAQMEEIDLIVTVDHFLTATAQASDLVLPATTCFETWDLVASYWHNWIGINQPAIEPVGESRSELEIAGLLSKTLNEFRPDTTPFPSEIDQEVWLSEELSPELCRSLEIDSYQELLERPRPLKIKNRVKEKINYSFQNPKAMEQGCPELPLLIAPKKPPKAYPYRFLLLHRLETLNSQLINMEWLETEQPESILFLSSKTAEKKGIISGEKIAVYNEMGEIQLIAKVKPSLQEDIVLCYSLFDLRGETVNILTGRQETDLGRMMYEFPGVAYHDTFVNMVRM
jgi:anaerobic selenocysteine-containing dehydrogenase